MGFIERCDVLIPGCEMSGFVVNRVMLGHIN